jgi:Fe-S-cluster containining protein
MFHGRVALFVENETWYLMVFADCQHLQPDNRCGVYHERPGICRAYSTDNCEYDDDASYDKYFETADVVGTWRGRLQSGCGALSTPMRDSR